jgi:hypothetical protein
MTRQRVTEAQWQRVVTDAARLHGWDWLHVHPLMTRAGEWRTPTSGTLANGWPDLLLVKGSSVIAVECKADDGRLTSRQREVHERLREAIPVYVWRPADLLTVLEALR